MKKTIMRGVVLCALSGLLALSFMACSSQNDDEDGLNAQVIDPAYELEFEALAQSDVEIRQVQNAALTLNNKEEYFVDFENENMALAVPLSLLLQAEEKEASIAMRYLYPEGSTAESICFYLPFIAEYEIYFPDAAAEDILLMVADVVVSDDNSAALRTEFSEQRTAAAEDKPVYATMLYLVDTSGTEEVALKLESIEERIIMREHGTIDEDALGARLYMSQEGKVYKPLTTVYYSTYEAGEGVSSFVDTTLYGSFVTTQGNLGNPTYPDVQGTYAQGALTQMQQSRNMAYALTQEESFEPNVTASNEDVLNAQGAFLSQPLMSDEAYARAQEGILDLYDVDQMFDYLIDPTNDFEIKSYVARVPYETAEVYEALGLEGSMDMPMQNGLALNSRISAALLGIGAFRDEGFALAKDKMLAYTPTPQEADEWLTGIVDVAADDPLRPYAALAVKYGLLFANGNGELNMYEPITRADLCMVYANLEALYEVALLGFAPYEGFGQTFVYAHAVNAHFNMEGAWPLQQATQVDGTAYTSEEISAEDAWFAFSYGSSFEHWTGEEYETTYVFCPQENTVTLYYPDGQSEVLQVSSDFSVLTYHYLNDADPEFSGETYVFWRR